MGYQEKTPRGETADSNLHKIGDDLTETWVEDWAGAGVAEMEEFLRKHAEFLRHLLESGEISFEDIEQLSV